MWKKSRKSANSGNRPRQRQGPDAALSRHWHDTFKAGRRTCETSATGNYLGKRSPETCEASRVLAEVLLCDKTLCPSDKETNAQAPGESMTQVARWRRNEWNLDWQWRLNIPCERDWSWVSNSLGARRRNLIGGSFRADKKRLARTRCLQAACWLFTSHDEIHNHVARRIVTPAEAARAPVDPVTAYGSYGEFRDDQGIKMEVLEPL